MQHQAAFGVAAQKIEFPRLVRSGGDRYVQTRQQRDKTRRYRIEQWGKRKQRSEPADNVIKNREEIKLLGIAIHVFNGSQPL